MKRINDENGIVCATTGGVIPLEPDAVGDEALIKWLSEQDYNVEQ